MVVIMMGRKRSMATGVNRVPRVLAFVRWASIAKSIIMMAFFFTTPISMINPDKGVQIQLLVEYLQSQQAPKTAEGRPERIVMGWMKLSYRMPSTI